MFCCEECQNYDSCTELGILAEECCSKCVYYEECKGDEKIDEEKDYEET